MSAYIQRLTEKRQNIWNQMKEMLDKASEEGRDLTAAEDETYQRMSGELDELRDRVKVLQEAEVANKDAEEALRSLETRTPVQTPDKADDTDAKLRSWLRGDAGKVFEIPREARSLEVRADQTTTTAAGTIPEGFYGQLWEYLIEVSGVLNLKPTILNTDSGETIKLPRATAHSTAGAVTEGQAISASDPTLGSVDSTVAKEGYLTQFTKELLDDTGVDLQGYLARSAGRALGNAVGAAAVTAAIAAATAGVTAGNAIGAVTSFGTQSTEGEGFDFLIDLFYSVIAPYRASGSCGWLMSDVTASKVRKLKSADGVYAWQPAVIAGQPDLILGKPVQTDTNVADPAASAKSILFGDWSSLVVRIAGGFRFERSDDFAFDADMSTFRALVRHGSVSVDVNALKSFVHAAS